MSIYCKYLIDYVNCIRPNPATKQSLFCNFEHMDLKVEKKKIKVELTLTSGKNTEKQSALIESLFIDSTFDVLT